MGGISGQKMWEASAERKTQSQMQRFADFCSESTQTDLRSWENLYSWSIEETAEFWAELAKFTGIIWKEQPDESYQPPLGDTLTGATWFPGSRLNFAENLLHGDDKKEALVCYRENRCTARLNFGDLKKQVAACAAAMIKAGVTKNDCVAGVLANEKEAVIGMLASASLGAIWSSCSPDFGPEGITDRLLQTGPKIIFFTGHYRYNGKEADCRETLKQCKNIFPDSVRFILCGTGDDESMGVETFGQFLGNTENPPPLTYTYTGFSHPLYIMFSSGTTGKPKAIIHSVGGTLLQHKKELSLHTDLTDRSRLLYFTTCGWMMWNWMVSALSVGATVITYDGSPAFPDAGRLWQLTDIENIDVLGISPRYLSACMNKDMSPGNCFSLAQLRTILSTGSPLLPEHYEWVYKNVKEDVHLASISGGTDIIACFMLGNPLLPVYSGEIQAAGLGMKIEAWNTDGHKVTCEKGELVCTKPFISMPLGFLNDPDHTRYRKAYFSRFSDKNIWHHGDFIEVTKRGGIVVYGRSDATLNPGGVRIGTSELYRQVETCEFVSDSLAAGLKVNGDIEVVLFVRLQDSAAPPRSWQETLKNLIRRTLTPRHVPKHIHAVKEIPYTRSGKKVEIAATRALHGEQVENTSAITNPGSLREYSEIGRILRSQT